MNECLSTKAYSKAKDPKFCFARQVQRGPIVSGEARMIEGTRDEHQKYDIDDVCS